MEDNNRSARRTPSPADGAAVLGNDDLLPLILLRVGFPTTLVRAALVCLRWYRVASHPDFLRRFRELHPPRVLGFYGDLPSSARPQFEPLAEAPELATAVRHAGAVDGMFVIHDCRNGRLLISSNDDPGRNGLSVLRPLHPVRRVAVVPPPPLSHWIGFRSWFLLPVPEDDGQDGAIVVVEVQMLPGTKFMAKVGTFRSGVWTVRTGTTVVLDLPQTAHLVKNMLPPVRGKIYMTVSGRWILKLDLVTTIVSVIRPPDAVNTNNYEISCGEDSELHLVHANGSLLGIWRREASGNGSGDGWVLVDDVIRVREAYNRREDAIVIVVDSNLEYVFLVLKTSRLLVSLHLKTRTEKVYGKFRPPLSGFQHRVVPFMMIWPPIFPALREENL